MITWANPYGYIARNRIFGFLEWMGRVSSRYYFLAKGDKSISTSKAKLEETDEMLQNYISAPGFSWALK